MTKKDREEEQFKLWILPELRSRLDAAAERYGRGTANKVAVEILQRYLQFWEELQESQRIAFDKQRARVGLNSEGTPRPVNVAKFEKKSRG